MSHFKNRDFTEDLKSAGRVGDIAEGMLNAIADPEEAVAVRIAHCQMLQAFAAAGYPAPSLALIKAMRITADSIEQMAKEWAERDTDVDNDANAWDKRRVS